MNFTILIKRILRRWYCVLAGLLAVAGLCYWVNIHTPLQYRIQGSVVLLPSPETVGGGNPYLFLNGLGQAMDVLTRRLAASSVKDPLATTYPHTTYTATADLTNGSSILLVSVTSETESDAQVVLSALMNKVPSILVGMQDELSVPPKGRIGSMPVTAQNTPTADSKLRIQLLALSAVGGVALTLLLTALIDGLVLRWTSRTGHRAVRSEKNPPRRKIRFRKTRRDGTPPDRTPANAPTAEVAVEAAHGQPLAAGVSESGPG